MAGTTSKSVVSSQSAVRTGPWVRKAVSVASGSQLRNLDPTLSLTDVACLTVGYRHDGIFR